MPHSNGFFDRRVMLVEDEPRLREMLLRAVREMGFEASAVGSAEQALRLLEQRPHPVLIVDLNLPGRGGMELVRAARQRWPAAQAIILTGFGDLDAARQAIHLDVVDFLTKPCPLGDLERALDRAFQRLLKHRAGSLPESIEGEQEEQEQGNERFDEGGEAETAEERSAGATQGVEVHRIGMVPGTRRESPPAAEGADGARGTGETPEPASFPSGPIDGPMSIDEIERRAIIAVLRKHGGNRHAAAAELGISLRKLYYRLARYQKQGLPLS